MTDNPNNGNQGSEEFSGEINDPIALLDQMGVEFENIARVFATYYQTLLRFGVPEELSKKLMGELHQLYWTYRLAVMYVPLDVMNDANSSDLDSSEGLW